MMTIPILVDTREQDTIAKVQAAFPQAVATDLGTDCGDLMAFLETGILIAERKTPDDLTNSVADGRLFRQSEHIPRLCRFSFLVIDGELRYSDDGFLFGLRPRIGWVKTGWRKASIESALIRVQLNGMCLIRDGYDSYTDAVKAIIAQCERADVPVVNRGKTRSINPFDQEFQDTLDWLATLPGIDTTKAVNLAKHFETDLRQGTMSRLELFTWILNRNGTEVEDRKNHRPALWGSVTHSRIRDFFQMRTGQRLKIESKTEIAEAV